MNLSFKQLLPPPPLPLVGSGAFCPLQGHTTDETGSGPSSDFDAHLPPSFPLSGENLSPFFFSLCLSFSFSEIWGCWPFVCVCVCVGDQTQGLDNAKEPLYYSATLHPGNIFNLI